MIAVIAEDWFDGGDSLAINGLAHDTIDFLFHLLGKGIGIIIYFALEESDLPGFSFIRVSETLRP